MNREDIKESIQIVIKDINEYTEDDYSLNDVIVDVISIIISFYKNKK